jgi:tetratricopeptide (TPR) repeat protein
MVRNRTYPFARVDQIGVLSSEVAMARMAPRRRKSFVAVAKTWGPAVTFIAGVAGSVYTAYNVLVVQPWTDQKARLASELSGIRTVRADAQSKALGKSDPLLLAQIQQSGATQEAGYIYAAERDVKGLEKSLNTEEWYVLASAEADQGHEEKAIEFLDKSVATTNDQLARISLIRTKADWVIRMRGDYDVSKSVLADAIRESEKLASPLKETVKASIGWQKALYASQTRHCDDFDSALKNFVAAARELEQRKLGDPSMRRSLGAALDQTGSCNYERADLS